LLPSCLSSQVLNQAERFDSRDKITIILNDAPYGTEKAYNALRYASALVASDVSVNLFLLADGAAAAKRGQKTPTGYYNVADMLADLIAKGVKVKT